MLARTSRQAAALTSHLSRLVAVAALLATTAVAQTTQQVSNVKAEARHGQTFVVFDEVPLAPTPTKYRVYRSTLPITKPADLTRSSVAVEVGPSTYFNKRANAPFVIKGGDKPLQKGQGFAVVTAPNTRWSYYAVTIIAGGKENTAISTGAGGNSVGPVIESVAKPEPVLQRVIDSGRDHFYVHFLPAITNVATQAFSNRKGRVLNYRLVFDPKKAGPRPVFLFLHARGGNFNTGNLSSWVPDNAIQIFVDDDNSPYGNSVWYGYHEDLGTNAPKGTVHDYTERRLLWTIDRLLANKSLAADPNRVYAYGISYGAMGALGLGVRHSDKFAAVCGNVPAFGVTHKDFSFIKEVERLWGTSTQNLKNTFGEGIYDVVDYSGQFFKRTAKGVAPQYWICGRGDTVTGWSDKPGFMAVARKMLQPATFYWDYRSHTSMGPWGGIEREIFKEFTQIRLDRPLPAFGNLSLDDDPGNGDRLNGTTVGTVGGYVRFDPTTAQETSTKVSLDIELRSNAARLDYAKQARATVDVTWRRLRAFQVQRGKNYLARMIDPTSKVVDEERIVTPDGNSLLTVRDLGVDRAKRRLELEAFNPTLPHVHLGGSALIGETLRFSILDSKVQPALLFIGSVEGKVPTPFGELRILDPVLAWAGATGPRIELPVKVPNDKGLRGVQILTQAIVNLRFTNLAKWRFR